MTTTPALNDDLVQRLTGENPDRVTPADRLRLYGTDPETFVFDSGDAWEAVELLEDAASALEAQSKEIEALRSALFVADDMIMTLHGCFPLDCATPEQRALNEGAKFVRSFTSDDYFERKRVVEDFRARTALKGA